jgi:hypothetical protein
MTLGIGDEPPPRTGWYLERAWTGELGLYRSAYGLGGIGLSVAWLAGELALAEFGSGPVASWLGFLLVGAAELGFAGLVGVATWRAALRGSPRGRPYGMIAVTLAFLFVLVQLASTLAWVGLSAPGIGPRLEAALLNHLLKNAGGDPDALDKLMKALGGDGPAKGTP